MFDNVIMAEFEKVKEAFEDPDKIMTFLVYMERCWVGRKVGLSIQKPRFPVSSWNLFHSALNECSLTNNSSEGCNSAWARALPSNASLWTVMGKFREVIVIFL